MKITNSTDLRGFVKGFYDQHVTALSGILEKLPEGLQGELAKLRDGLNEQLSKLPSVDQVPAAQDAAWAFNSFADAWVRMQEYSKGLLDRLTAMQSDLASKATALNGLQEQITKGELLAKDKVAEACALARAEGVQSMVPELRATRKSALELAGLPVPAEAILDLPSKDYEPRVTAAKDQVAKLGAKGLKLGGKGAAWVQQLAWLGATEFAGQMTALEEVLGGGQTRPAGDPLLGGGAGADEKAPGPQITLV
jgi:hypothetical protein